MSAQLKSSSMNTSQSNLFSKFSNSSTELTQPSLPVRRSLRERCGFKFTLNFSPSNFRCSSGKPPAAPIPIPITVPTKPKRVQSTHVIPTLKPEEGKGHLGPHVTNLPRRKAIRRPAGNGNKFAVVQAQTNKNITNDSNALRGLVPPPLPPRPLLESMTPPFQRPNFYVPRFNGKDECRCLQQIIPGCYVAFEDDILSWNRAVCGDVGIGGNAFFRGVDETLEPPRGDGWTHIINISRPPPNGLPCGCEAFCSIDHTKEGPISYDVDSKTLYLTLPASTSNVVLPPTITTPHSDCPSLVNDIDDDDDDNTLYLKHNQLLYARDFISFFGHSLTYPTTTTATVPTDTPVRILITTPRNHRTEALSIVFGYLAFAFHKRVDQVMVDFESRDDCLSVWKDALGKSAIETVEKVVAV